MTEFHFLVNHSFNVNSMRFLKSSWINMCEECKLQSAATNRTGDVKKIHTRSNKWPEEKERQGFLFFLDFLHLPAQCTAFGLCETCPSVFC